MEWISVKERTPYCNSTNEIAFSIAFHTIYGVGVAWFFQIEPWEIEELEEGFRDKYICSAHFIRDKLDGNHCVEEEDDIDIFFNGACFKNLGTITHWMPLPERPKDSGYCLKDIKKLWRTPLPTKWIEEAKEIFPVDVIGISDDIDTVPPDVIISNFS